VASASASGLDLPKVLAGMAAYPQVISGSEVVGGAVAAAKVYQHCCH